MDIYVGETHRLNVKTTSAGRPAEVDSMTAFVGGEQFVYPGANWERVAVGTYVLKFTFRSVGRFLIAIEAGAEKIYREISINVQKRNVT